MDQPAWPTLMNSMCGGMHQTPIDLPTMTTPEADPIAFRNYGAVPLRLVNNGHTLQVNISTAYGPNDPHVTVGESNDYLVQFHGHTRSEHTVEGRSFPMEWHFVHASNSTPMAQLLVVGVMFDLGDPHPTVETVLTQDPGEECQRTRPDTTLDLGTMLPGNRSHYHYSPGSLTTPLCNEGLNWFVLSTPLAVSDTQVSRFAAVVHGRNNRDIQDVNGRTVFRYVQPVER